MFSRDLLRRLSAHTPKEAERILSAISAEGDVATLVGLFEAFLHTAEALSGFLERVPIGAAGDAYGLVNSEAFRMRDLAQGVIEAMEKMSFVYSRDDLNSRSQALARWDMYCGCSPQGVATTLLTSGKIPLRPKLKSAA
jgi:hypothetical protein